MDERLYVVTYDIADDRRWRRVFKLMNGYGEWLQLSVFQCRLQPIRRAEMVAALEKLIHHGDDHVLIVDLRSAPYLRGVIAAASLKLRVIRPHAIQPGRSPWRHRRGLIEAYRKHLHVSRLIPFRISVASSPRPH